MKNVKDEHQSTEPKATHRDKVEEFTAWQMTKLWALNANETDEIEKDYDSF